MPIYSGKGGGDIAPGPRLEGNPAGRRGHAAGTCVPGRLKSAPWPPCWGNAPTLCAPVAVSTKRLLRPEEVTGSPSGVVLGVFALQWQILLRLPS